MKRQSVANALWHGDTVAARLGRGLLTPLSWAFERGVSRRNASFDAAGPARAALPAISIGNLTVGGTGKTPIAAWFVQQLRQRGARPSIVMRGVGDDEWRVHRLLNRGVPVIVSPNRADGLVVARTRGSDCAVLDDAFQHRSVGRVVDVVLLSADRWDGRVRLLPCGPFREPMGSVRRAQLVIVTVKAASDRRIDDAVSAVRETAPDVPWAVVRLSAGTIRLALGLDGESATAKASAEAPASPSGSLPGSPTGAPRRELLEHQPSWLRGRSLLAVSAIGDPEAFEAQLGGAGAILTHSRRYPDHHGYTSADVASLLRDQHGASGVICTLKDAVKLAPLWPREAPLLWYVSQSVVIERGAEAIGRAVDRLLAARAGTTPTAG